MIILIVAFCSYRGLLYYCIVLYCIVLYCIVLLYYELKREMLKSVSLFFWVFWGTLPCGVHFLNTVGTPEP
jgi:hypothetical protein